jgi:hypothetical protein
MSYDPRHMLFFRDLIDLIVEVTFMVSRCFNPGCQVEFRALNSGSLYAFERRSADTKFLWLCSACVPLVSLFINLTGSVAVGPKLIAGLRQPPDQDSRLRLVYNSLDPAPWLRACVAREQCPPDKHSCDPLSSSSDAA